MIQIKNRQPKIDPWTVYLMYHELESPGRELCQNDPGYVHYVISAADFEAQLGLLADHGYRGLSVSEALAGGSPATDLGRGPAAPVVVFTFDDGCETDLLYAAPLLKARAYDATFFLVTGFVGRRGYLAPAQVQALGRMGFEIGCHSMTHPDLSRLAPAALRTEVVDAKDKLEQIIGLRVDHFSCPGGRWSPEVARLAREAGYRSVSTSRIGANSTRSDRYRLGRVAMLRGESSFLRLCQGRGLGFRRFKQSLRSAVRSAVGESAYDRLRGALLR